GPSGYGYPLEAVQQADAALTRLQARAHAGVLALSLPTLPRYRAPLDYLLVSEHAGRIAFTNDCLLLPLAPAGTSLLLTTQPPGPAGALAARLPTAHHLADVSVPGGAPWPVYALSGPPPLLADERALAPVDFVDAAGNGLRLEAIATAPPGA